MRLTTIILLITLLQVSAATKAQNLTLKTTDASLKSIFTEVKKQTGYMIVAPSALIKKAKPVTVDINNLPLKDALNRILEKQNMEFEIEDNSIVVRAKAPSFSDKVAAAPALIDVHGKVVDEKGHPLPGVTVRVKDGSLATVTDTKGEFYLMKVDEKAVLQLSFIGFLTREVNVNTDLSEIKLEVSNSKLDEVQVIAYGTTSQRYSTSNIGTVRAAEIAKQPVSNPLLALQGRVPGLFIEQTSGVTAGSPSVTIQGRNSIAKGNTPFYVIDGVPYSPTFTGYGLLSNSISGDPGSLNFLNPGDIESISILKDADATAIYGSRAANGAILITTKKGKAGKTKVDVNLQNGWGKITHKVDFLNTQQYLEMRKEAYKNAGVAVPTSASTPISSNYDLTLWDPIRYTDWQKVLVGGTAKFTDVQASVSGGSTNTQFVAGYGYNRQTTVYPTSLADEKGSLHLNLNHNSADNKFRYSLTASYLEDKNQLNGSDLMNSAVTLAPNAPELYATDGSLNWEPFPTNPNRYSFNNPLIFTKQRYTGNTTNLVANNTIGYEFLPGLQLKASLGYNKIQGNETFITPITVFRPDAAIKSRQASYLTKATSSWIAEPQLTYVKNTKFGVFDLLLGGTFQQSKTDVLSQTGTGYSNDAQLENILAAPNLQIDNVYKSLYRYDAIFGRINYRLQDKYIVNLTARRDGSSRFGDENKFHTFYAVGGAWLFGDEQLISKALPWLSTGKLRASYGTTGNDQIDDYSYLSLLDSYPLQVPYQGGVGLYATNIYNPYLQWEETRKLNIGIQLGFLKDRIDLDINYFRNRSSNQLLGFPLPATTGFGNLSANLPATVQNIGIEVMLNVYPIKSKNFNWHASVNFTRARNKLLSFPGLETSTYASDYLIGLPINAPITKVYKFAGVNPTTGLYQFVNSKGELTSDPDETTDRTELVDINPKWYGGISNSFEYKGLQLDFLVQVVKQMAQNYRFGNLAGLNINQPVSVLDRWQKPGDVTDIQKFSSSTSLTRAPYNAARNSDASYSGASYLRLKNVSLSFALPQDLLKTAHISNLRVYAQGQNLLTVTQFIGSDPETKGLGALPPLKVFTLGIQIGL
ncbi:TonB-linked outer membrane protein, SusC/RagA family [Mucilaginibacter pineti]|uniref:TonB-linked outer membrane protein, SusC/RagA family n=2 Tax=Mucilaginibacter pineti TaxID=1391627 RepID=A0A1G7GBI1_9SPHI|nr:TonB-linked outer membrane protein, SusC/RagA family [Mucilaginibacter pineti]